ncbi:hypothetical protein BBP40_002560 [Aspergillus hancockii]|nr:hypothetical protein BBP40_002560 [Aspergillus hancockii]
MFMNLIERGLDYNKGRLASRDIHVSYSIYNCVDGEFPTFFMGIDAIIVTGAPESAYDLHPWIAEMRRILRNVYAHYPGIKLFGSCFGHQIIASALLGSHGVYSEKNLKGWAIGVHPVDLSQEFLHYFPHYRDGDRLVQRRIQFIHQDHVVVPGAALPGGWMTVGKSSLCEIQGLFQPGRVLLYQGHAEFDRYVTREILDYVNDPSWSKEDVARADQVDDSDYFAGLLVSFLLS